MTEQTPFAGQDMKPVRLEFSPSLQLAETLELLVRPGLRETFGAKTLRVVAKDVLLPASNNPNYLTTKYEQQLARYSLAVMAYEQRQFLMRPRVDFKRDGAENLYVGMWMAVTASQRRTIQRPPLYEVPPAPNAKRPSIGLAVRIPRVSLLPNLLFTEAWTDVQSAFGMDDESAIESGLAPDSLYVSDLYVHKLPTVVSQHGSEDQLVRGKNSD